jgi:para-nitrobenzyl esterase
LARRPRSPAFSVTVFGESAGGGSVAALLAMPRAAGLFRGAVAQSVPGLFFAPELAADITVACAAEPGVWPTAAGLSAVDPGRPPGAALAVSGKIDRWRDRWAPTVTAYPEEASRLLWQSTRSRHFR